MTDYDISIFSNKNNGKFTPLGSGLNDIIADLKKNKVGVVFIPDETAMTGVSRSAEAAVNDAISQLKPKTFFLDQQDGADNRAKVENIKAGARGSELAASSLVGPSKMGVAQDQMLTRFDILKQTDIKLARPDGGINPDFRKEMQDAKKAVVAEEKDAKED